MTFVPLVPVDPISMSFFFIDLIVFVACWLIWKVVTKAIAKRTAKRERESARAYLMSTGQERHANDEKYIDTFLAVWHQHNGSKPFPKHDSK